MKHCNEAVRWAPLHKVLVKKYISTRKKYRKNSNYSSLNMSFGCLNPVST
jgi:hypothetical protein